MSLTTTDRSIIAQTAGKIAAELVPHSLAAGAQGTLPDLFRNWHAVVNDTILSVLEDSANPPVESSTTPPSPVGPGTTPNAEPPAASPTVETGGSSRPNCKTCGGPSENHTTKNGKACFRCANPNCKSPGTDGTLYRTIMWPESGA